MSHNRGVSYAATLLLVISLSYIGLLVSGFSTYSSFANPYRYIPTGQVSSINGMGVIPLANYTVVFVLDGARADTFYQTPKPKIQSLGNWANFTGAHCSTLLSVSRTGYGVIGSGVNSTESGVISNDIVGVFPADSIWNTTIANSGTTTVVGSNDWNELFGPWLNYSLTFTSTMPGQSAILVNATAGAGTNEVSIIDYRDSLVSSYARLVVERHQPTLMLVHFCGTDEAGHENGTASESYVNALKNEDSYIGDVLDAYAAAGLLNSTLVVVTADHGQVDVRPGHGEHGGTEEEALHIPLLMRGPGVNPGIYEVSVHQNSIAPTIAAVMGWAVPSDCSGTVLFDCLTLSPKQEAIYRINLSEIRAGQAKITATKMGYISLYAAQVTETARYLAYSRSNFTAANWTIAIDNAVSAEAISLNVLRSSWAAKATEERTLRLVIVVASSFGIVLLGAILLRGPLAGVKTTVRDTPRMLAVIIAVAAYFGFLLVGQFLFGWRFSASYFFINAEDLVVRILGPSLLALALSGLLLLLLLRAIGRKQPVKSSTATWTTAFAALVAVVYLLITAYFIVDTGQGLLWFVHDADRPLMYFFVVLSYLAFVLFAFLASLGSKIILAISKRGVSSN